MLGARGHRGREGPGTEVQTVGCFLGRSCLLRLLPAPRTASTPLTQHRVLGTLLDSLLHLLNEDHG